MTCSQELQTTLPCWRYLRVCFQQCVMKPDQTRPEHSISVHSSVTQSHLNNVFIAIMDQMIMCTQREASFITSALGCRSDWFASLVVFQRSATASWLCLWATSAAGFTVLVSLASADSWWPSAPWSSPCLTFCRSPTHSTWICRVRTSSTRKQTQSCMTSVGAKWVQTRELISVQTCQSNFGFAYNTTSFLSRLAKSLQGSLTLFSWTLTWTEETFIIPMRKATEISVTLRVFQ